MIWRALIFAFFELVSFSARAQVTIRTPALEAYNRCLNSAIDSDGATRQGTSITYECVGSPARDWFNALPLSGEQEIVSRTSGRWEYRYFGRREAGFCGHQIENANGEGANSYACVIYAAAPN
jgi:hypothetical protein